MKSLLIIYVLSSGIVATSSAYNIHHGCGEVNPFAPKTVKANIAYKTGMTVGLTYYFRTVHKHRPKLGKALALFGIGFNSLDSTLNILADCRK